MSTQLPVGRSQVAETTPFDNTTNGFIAENTQEAIEELAEQSASSASPGFTWGDSGTSNAGSFLLNDSVESSKAGRLVPFDGFVTEFFVNNERTTGAKILELVRRRPCQTGPWVAIAEVTVPNGIACGKQAVNVAVLADDELAIRVKTGSSQFSNAVVGIIIKNNTGSGAVGGRFLQTEDDGVLQEATTTKYDFTGPGVTASSDGLGNVTVNVPGSASAGETNTASNIGPGSGIFAQKVGVDLQFKSITGTGGISVTTDADEVIINTPVLDQQVNKIAEAGDSTGGQAVSTTGFANLAFDSLVSSSVASATATGITVNIDGFYEIKYDYSANGNSATRSESQSRLTLNGTPIPLTLRPIYHRTTAQGAGSATATKYLQLSVGDVIALQAQRSSGGAPITTEVDGTVLSVKYLRSAN